MTESRKQKPGN